MLLLDYYDSLWALVPPLHYLLGQGRREVAMLAERHGVVASS